MEHSLIEPHIIILHDAPMSPPKTDRRWSTIHLQHLPSKRRHHSLKRLMAARKIAILGAVVLVGRDDGIVRSELEHVLSGLWG